MTTGTEGNDNLTNDPAVNPETVDALGGDDVITIVQPNAAIQGLDQTVSVNGGAGNDTLILNPGRPLSGISASGMDGSTRIRLGSSGGYTVNWTSIERFEFTGGLFGNGSYITGDSVDIFRIGGGFGGTIETGGGNDEIYFSSDPASGLRLSVNAGTGNDIVDFSAVTARNPFGWAAAGGDGNDVIRGSNAVDQFGAGPTDFLNGGAGNDMIIGNAGIDELTGDAGADTLIGGAEDGSDGEIDSVLYNGETGGSGVLVNLSGSAATLGGISLAAGTARDTFGDTDRLIGIERIRGSQWNDHILGGAGANRFEGESGDDRLVGNGGTDELIGGAGADTLIGGAENGFDTDDDWVRYDLERNFNSGNVAVNLSGSAATVGGILLAAGTARDSFGDIDTLVGIEFVRTGGGDDHLLGGSGADRFESGDGNDILDGGDGADMLSAGSGNNILNGGVGNDELSAGAGNDMLNGGAGADILNGGGGNDIYIDVEEGDTVIDSGGLDEVRTTLAIYTLPQGVETLTAADDVAHDFRGNSSDNVISGGAATDIFRLEDGGNETVAGGGGNDGFIFGASFTAADRVDGGAGNRDQLSIQGDYSAGLTFGAQSLINVETLLVLPGFDYQLTSVDANVAAGGRLEVFGTTLGAADEFVFNGSAETDGHFVFYGGAGRDTLTGGTGNDGFYFGPGNFSQTDTLFGGAGSNDQLGLDGHYTITLGGNFEGIETLVLYRGPEADLNRFDLTATDAMVAAGQRFTVFGTTVGTNLVFNGSAELDGSFRILGGQGNDMLAGGRGDDILFGARGGDHLAGLGGNDVFLYQDVAESTAAALDRIADLGSGDKVDLSTIDAIAGTAANEAFSFIGANAFSGVAGELRFFQADNRWRVEADVDGDSIADLVISVATLNGYVPGAADFVF